MSAAIRVGRAALWAGALALILAALASGGASAAAGPIWGLESVANTNAAPGSTHTYYLALRDIGDAPTSGPYVLEVELPSGITATSVADQSTPTGPAISCEGDTPGGAVLGASRLTCKPTAEFGVPPVSYKDSLALETAIAPSAEGNLTASFEISGGGAPAVRIAEATSISRSPPGFGVEGYDSQRYADPAGVVSTQAAAHPYSQVTELSLNTDTDPTPSYGDATPIEPLKDAVVELPPGFVGNPTAVRTCTAVELAHGVNGLDMRPLCAADSQVGVVNFRYADSTLLAKVEGAVPLYNMVAPPGVAARLGFEVFGTIIVLDGRVRSGGDYGITLSSSNVSEALPLNGVGVETWGTPSDEVHLFARACPDRHPPSQDSSAHCAAETSEGQAFLRNPTSCEAEAGGIAATIFADSWDHPGAYDADGNPELADPAWSSLTSISHLAPGFPAPPEDWGAVRGPTGCDRVPFEPGVSVQPTAERADSPSGLEFDLRLPQEALREPGAIAESDLRSTLVTLPAGMTINPSAASGLESCSGAQIGLKTPVGAAEPRFSAAAARCPEAAKVGALSIQTPLLDHPLQGAVYLAQPQENPFGSLLALYLVVDDPASGVVLKLPAQISSDPDTGQLLTSFHDLPQLPFEELHLSFFSGPRAALRTPSACGTYATSAKLTPWSGTPPVDRSDSFAVTEGCGGGFDPHFEAGAQNPLAGAFTPFNLRVTRPDGSPELSSIAAKLPPGLLGKLKGISYCPESALLALAASKEELGAGARQEASPSCPAASAIGTATVGAGAGPTPFFSEKGRIYLAGPYRGAPYSLAIIAPAIAGPFDLGTILGRNPVDIDPETAAISVEPDPFPTSLHGIPLDLRDVRVDIDRPDFTLNPTNCKPMKVGSTITSTQGLRASPAVHFQLSGCERLGFRPKLSLRLKGAVNHRAHPRLIANLRARPGDANIARAQVKLPPAAFLDNARIGTVCTRVQFAAKSCPPDSVYGRATASTPLLNYPLAGPVYLRSSQHKLPDLLIALRGTYGEEVEVDLAGRTDSVNGALRSTFAAVPDAPVSRFHLELFGGARGLIQMSAGFCAQPNASVRLDAQNGRVYDTTPKVRAQCGGKISSRRHRSAR